jgi:two-component system sensor histidine kinase SenX3
VLAGPDGEVVYRNSAARALAGTHAGVLIDETIERHLRGAADGQATEELLDLYGPPKLVVVVRARSLRRGGAYALVEDISERRRIDDVRTDFVANISHELKTPVGALAVLAETLADERDEAVVQRIADRMLDESHRASRTIDDLLELSRIELGGELVRDGVDAAEVVRGAVARAAALADQRRIRVEVVGIAETDGADEADEADEVAGAVRLTGDRRQLVSAVGNLVENAVKYSEAGGHVQITTRVDGPWVEFAVADHGVGIPARDLDRIFERFYRVDKARSRGTGGTGLGLAIVRHVATNHGGEVTVTSREGEGSTFVLRVPGPAAAGGDHPRGAT